MSTVKVFECDHCGAEGKITIKGDDFRVSEVVYCPLCSSSIYDEDDDDRDDFDD